MVGVGAIATAAAAVDSAVGLTLGSVASGFGVVVTLIVSFIAVVAVVVVVGGVVVVDSGDDRGFTVEGYAGGTTEEEVSFDLSDIVSSAAL